MAEKLTCTVENESDIRWSAREGAVRVIATHFSELIELLQSLNEDETESTDTKGKAGNLVTSLLTFDFVCFLSFLAHVLPKINIIQKRLQSPKMNLQEAAVDLGSLCQNLTDE